MAKWFLATKRAEFEKIGEKYGISPVLARIIRNRDIVEDADIEKYLYGYPKRKPKRYPEHNALKAFLFAYTIQGISHKI